MSDDDLSAPPRTSPLAVGAFVSLAVASTAIAGCSCTSGGELPWTYDANVRSDSGGEGFPDTYVPADAGIDMAFPGELPSPPPDTNPTDAGPSNS